MLVYELMHSESFADSYQLVSIENCMGDFLTLEEMEMKDRRYDYSWRRYQRGCVKTSDINEDEFKFFGLINGIGTQNEINVGVGVILINETTVNSVVSDCVQLMSQLPENKKTIVLPVNVDNVTIPTFFSSDLVVSDMSDTAKTCHLTEMIKDLIRDGLREQGLKLHGDRVSRIVRKKKKATDYFKPARKKMALLIMSWINSKYGFELNARKQGSVANVQLAIIKFGVDNGFNKLTSTYEELSTYQKTQPGYLVVNENEYNAIKPLIDQLSAT